MRPTLSEPIGLERSAPCPDPMAPIVRNAADGDRELVMTRWGMPGPPQFRRSASHEYSQPCESALTRMVEQTKPLRRAGDFVLRVLGHEAAQDAHVVRLSEDRPLFAFTGLWMHWHGVRGPKSAPVEGVHELSGFLTTEANAIVAPIHPKAMPVILTKPDVGKESK
jgi:putative SOS response-associated peptidase YedK